MARTGTTAPKTTDEPGQEEPVDYMAEAPAARPYSEAITESHRELLSVNGIRVPEAE